MVESKDIPKKLGYKYAVESTIKIAENLPNKQNKSLYKQTVRAIFNDLLIAHTNFNREQRHERLKSLNKELKALLR